MADDDAQPATVSKRQGAERRWRARLELGFQVARGQTVLMDRRHEGPLGVQRAFHPESDGTCHVYLLHPPGGVAGGDELTVEVTLGTDARALLTLPAATKFYDGFGDRARQQQQFRVERGALLEWLPQETIVFDGADVDVHSGFDLAAGAGLCAWEILCLGRPACGERFTRGAVRQRLEVCRDGRPLFIERTRYRGGDPSLDGAWGLAGHPVTGTFVCAPADPAALSDGLVERLRTLCGVRFAGRFAVTRLREVLVCRFLGGRTEDALDAFRSAWTLLRPALYDRAPQPPRIWLT